MTSERKPMSRMAREIELLWGLDEPGAPRRGPKPQLSREAVVRAAITVADTEGLEAVSMQRVAKELGYTTMSLYRHVDSKEDMLALMADTVMNILPPPPRDDGDWRAGVEAWCHAVLEAYRRHPWLVYVEMAGPPSGPGGLRWMEAGLRELDRSGLGLGESLQMLVMFSAVLRETARMENEMNRAARAQGATMADTEREYSLGLRRVVTPERFPTLARLLEEDVLSEQPREEAGEWDGGPAQELDLGLHRILDGIEVHIERQRGKRRD
ncbi:TetR/AcrR family transcriptional regulator [Nocardiopsis algeriensis]|uniref:AcrR family transcriptional regulator n=1 Tax=Nocardiopsis algeriensis TaxID=1478215 RepID=A0A841IR43_9ACTN|nr:TetR/AcrR family transcriptional regulator [Nocardiopsis algeriensis]MBB6121157.1 AcrR family transcriptional regulator [Nocardiopsis algeriensis]